MVGMAVFQFKCRFFHLAVARQENRLSRQEEETASLLHWSTKSVTGPWVTSWLLWAFYEGQKEAILPVWLKVGVQWCGSLGSGQ